MVSGTKKIWVLVGVLALFRMLLSRRKRKTRRDTSLSFVQFAVRSASRNAVRSLLTVGPLACATLLIVTVATFRKDPSLEHPGPKESGTGGFNLLVRTDLPVYADLSTPAGREAPSE